MAEDKELAGKVAIVTGAGRNIGRAIALQLAQAGASVVVNVRSNQVEADGVVREIEAAGGKAMAALADKPIKTRTWILRTDTIEQKLIYSPRINCSPLLSSQT